MHVHHPLSREIILFFALGLSVTSINQATQGDSWRLILRFLNPDLEVNVQLVGQHPNEIMSVPSVPSHCHLHLNGIILIEERETGLGYSSVYSKLTGVTVKTE